MSAALKRTVEDRFGQVRVRGEISGWKRAASGHCYFTLKDADACIDAVLWKGQAGRLAFAPEDGAEVIATGKVTTYPGRSKYQIVVNAMELAGEGALMALLEKRKKAMAAEGLFASERKRALPYLPRVIGVVTSPTGAVIRDILHRLEDRCPTHVVVWPVQVQGESAAAQVAEAIAGFDALAPGGPVPRPDLLIVARGGGSIEDLWSFNEEVVVRAAAACSIPLISAVGHETDTTLIDHVSDRRAPTPTAAAEMAVPVLAELRGWIGELERRARDRLERSLAERDARLDDLGQRLPSSQRLTERVSARLAEATRGLRSGLRLRAESAAAQFGRIATRHRGDLLERQWQAASERTLDAAARLGQGLRTRARQDEERLDAMALRSAPALERIVRTKRERWSEAAARLRPEPIERSLADLSRRLEAAWARAQAENPDGPLARGFARVMAGDEVVTSAAAARGHARLSLVFADGEASVRPEDGPAAQPARVAKPRTRAYRGADQRGLFDAADDGDY